MHWYSGAISLKQGLSAGGCARIIFEATGIKDNQAALALDKIYRSYTGRSTLTTGEIQLEAPNKQQLLTPTEIAEHFGFAKSKTGARVINKILADAGYQGKVETVQWTVYEEKIQEDSLMEEKKSEKLKISNDLLDAMLVEQGIARTHP